MIGSYLFKNKDSHNLKVMENAIEPRLMTFWCLNWRMLMWMSFSYCMTALQDIHPKKQSINLWVYYLASFICDQVTSRIVCFYTTGLFLIVSMKVAGIRILTRDDWRLEREYLTRYSWHMRLLCIQKL